MTWHFYYRDMIGWYTFDSHWFKNRGFPIFVQSERGISLSLHWHQLFSFLPILRVINLCPRRITLETFILSPTRIFLQMSKFFALFSFFDQKLFFLISINFKLESAIYWLTSDFSYQKISEKNLRLAIWKENPISWEMNPFHVIFTVPHLVRQNMIAKQSKKCLTSLVMTSSWRH